MLSIIWILVAALIQGNVAPVSATSASNSESSVTSIDWNAASIAACLPLSIAGLGSMLFYPSDAEYNESITTYYSGSVQAVRPSCILRPQNTLQVALAVKTLSYVPGSGWAVAVRGGGHAFFPAANNVARGVVIDLSEMDAIKYVACKAGGGSCQATDPKGGITSVGPGARWGPVYAEVEKYGMTVAGGREAHVGVSGLLLGGGFSYHAGRRGLSCDNVVNYQVVLSSGAIVDANAKTNPDLFKALKGGSNNLGIVTKYDLDTWPSRGFYGGITAFDYSQKIAVINLFVRAIDINIANPDDEEFVSFSYTTGSPSPSIALVSMSVDGNPNSTTFAPLVDIPVLFNTRGPTTYSALTTLIQGALGIRNVWYTLSFDNTKDMMTKATSVFEAMVADLSHGTSAPPPPGSINLIYVFQPLAKQFAALKGINILGLDTTLTKNAILLQVEALVDTLEYEMLMTEKLGAATKEIEEYAKKTGQNTPWRYLNYANPTQDPIGSYGAKNVALLKKASAKYDPIGFFQRRVSGGFKL